MFRFLSTQTKTTNSKDDSFVIIDNESSQTKHRDKIPEVFELPKCNGLDLFEVTVDELQHHFSSGSLTSVQYTTYCLENIRRANPYLECVIETNPDALAIAAVLDRERKDGKARGPLHGIPVLVKDNMATADKMETTGGSWALLGCKVPKDAHIVHLLRKAGAVIIGKANLDEWAGMRSHEYSIGWSARGGQCRNAYLLNRSPGGSSAGSAVAVTANLVPLAFGTETDCSIIHPGMLNGVVAIKPTVGLTSRGGVIPISETQDSTGPFGRTVADCVRALDVIAGPDPDDKFSTMPDRRHVSSYYNCLVDYKALKGAKFGLPMKRFWETAPEPQRKVVEYALRRIRHAGAEIIEVDMPCAEERLSETGDWDWERYGTIDPSTSEITVSKIQTYYLMNAYLSQLTNTPIHTLDDIVAYNNQNRGSEGGHPYDIPAFPDGQPLFEDCVKTRGIKTDDYHSALKHITSQCREHGIDAALRYRRPHPFDRGEVIDLDALLFCDVKRGGIQIAAQAGYPVITVPVGLDPDGMPVSLVLIHSKWQDDKLVRWASAIEDLFGRIMEVKTGRCASGSGKGSGSQKRRTLKRGKRIGRIPPTCMNHLRKNVPVEAEYRYEGCRNPTGEPWPKRDADPDEGRCRGKEGEDDEVEEWERARYLV